MSFLAQSYKGVTNSSPKHLHVCYCNVPLPVAISAYLLSFLIKDQFGGENVYFSFHVLITVHHREKLGKEMKAGTGGMIQRSWTSTDSKMDGSYGLLSLFSYTT